MSPQCANVQNHTIPRIPHSNDSVFCLLQLEFQNPNMDITLLRVLLSSFFIVAAILGLFGSILILFAVKRKAIRLDKITTVLILHVAVLDLLAALIYTVPITLTVTTGRWYFGNVVCTAQAFAKTTVAAASSLAVCALNFSKLTFVLFPFRAERWASHHGHILGAMVWIISIIMGIVKQVLRSSSNVRFHYELMSCLFEDNLDSDSRAAFGTFILLALGIICVIITSLWLIGIATKMSLSQGRSVNLQGLITVILIAVVYCCTFAPLFDMYLRYAVSPTGVSLTRQMVCGVIVFLNHFTNVFIYYISVTRFRLFVKKKIAGVVRCGSVEPSMEVTNVSVIVPTRTVSVAWQRGNQ